MMNEKKMATALKRYNNIMMSICCEHHTIGTRFSEGTENWNLRDMVAECDYNLSTYFESGHCNCEEMMEDCPQERINEINRLRRFINHYKDEAMTMEPTEGHCSRFDLNPPRFLF